MVDDIINPTCKVPHQRLHQTLLSLTIPEAREEPFDVFNVQETKIPGICTVNMSMMVELDVCSVHSSYTLY